MKNMTSSLVRISALLAAFIALPSYALYKVVGPDGRVTYTDTPPPANSGAKVTELSNSLNVVAAASLPLELRQAVARYPVTLYTAKGCSPCDAGRDLLRQRGVPFNEKLVQSQEDVEALAKLSGSRDAPTMTIGAQVLHGFSTSDWTSYLDAAGYPRESRLPSNYQYPAATPLTEPPPPPRPAAPPPAPAPTAPPPSPSGIKF